MSKLLFDKVIDLMNVGECSIEKQFMDYPARGLVSKPDHVLVVKCRLEIRREYETDFLAQCNPEFVHFTGRITGRVSCP
jgi:hypothetical protein